MENFYKAELKRPQSSYEIKVSEDIREVVNEKSQHLVFEWFLLKSLTKDLTNRKRTLRGEEAHGYFVGK